MQTNEHVDLATWLTAVWDEEERSENARRTWRPDAPPMDVTTTPDGDGVYVSNPGSSIQHWLSFEDYDRTYLTPAPNKQVLARIAADRKILARCMRIWSEHEEGGPLNGLVRAVDAGLIVHDLASPYRDRPDFPESAVERQGVEG